MANNQRPRFEASHDHLNTYSLGDGWNSLLSCSAGFSQEIFELGTTQLVHHPEYNSTLILRSEVISDQIFGDAASETDPPSIVPTFSGLRPVRCIHRKLLPRRPGRDAALEQYCTFYRSSSMISEGEPSIDDSPNTLVLTPIVEEGASLPYYHPAVSHIAFRFLSIPSATDTPSSSDSPTPLTILRIDVQPLAGVSLNPNDRLYRTSLALLETVYRYCWGAITQYKKRVVHDALVPRDRYQDLYLVMRERHKGLVDTWKEVTDPLKHVFEDIGIATYLMLLWKDTFSGDGSAESDTEDLTQEPWEKWPRPPGGFLDLGCGNGLLTHILTAEGYAGIGIDLRARMSWEGYPAETRAALRVAAVDPTRMFDADSEGESGENRTNDAKKDEEQEAPTAPSPSRDVPTELPPTVDIAPGSFIIANHADELTPWTPVLATLSGAAGYLSIPCCAWAFDARFQRGKGPAFPSPDVEDEGQEGLQDNAVPDASTLSITSNGSRVANKERERQEKEAEEAFIETLNLGGDGSGNSHKSAYSQYRIWLARLSAHCGWEIECETLRIPSTRAWAVVGRRKVGDAREQRRAVANARAIVEDVKRQALFKTRRPEGRDGLPAVARSLDKGAQFKCSGALTASRALEALAHSNDGIDGWYTLSGLMKVGGRISTHGACSARTRSGESPSLWIQDEDLRQLTKSH